MLMVFLLSVVAISFSGAMTPGPVLAVTITNSYYSWKAGPLIAIGHGIIEIPLMFLIFFGFTKYLKLAWMKIVIGIIGGIILLYMGIKMVKDKAIKIKMEEDPSYHPLVGGAITTAANPYFFIWWITIGSALILKSIEFGLKGFIIFIPAHWLCDFGWYFFVSLSVYKTRYLWSRRLYQNILKMCGLVLSGFGIYFIVSVFI